MDGLKLWLAEVGRKAYVAFIEQDRWKLYLKGLGITMEVAFFAAIIGIIIGTVLAFMKLSVKRNGKPSFLARIANAYIDIIRGTPSVLQLLIMWFIILSFCRNKILVACLSFGINSGAYVAEIVRAGILAVDKGQTEAGRSLGLSYATTMKCVIIPQAFKNVLPALGNELITLLKETSIVTVIGLKDLTKGAMIIQGKTYQAIVPFLAIAAIYLAMVMILTTVLGRLERRMRKNDQR